MTGTRTEAIWRKQAILNTQQETLRDTLRVILIHGDPTSRSLARLALEEDKQWAEKGDGR